MHAHTQHALSRHRPWSRALALSYHLCGVARVQRELYSGAPSITLLKLTPTPRPLAPNPAIPRPLAHTRSGGRRVPTLAERVAASRARAPTAVRGLLTRALDADEAAEDATDDRTEPRARGLHRGLQLFRRCQ